MGLDTQIQFQWIVRPWIEPLKVLEMWNYWEAGKDNVDNRERDGWDSCELTTGNKNVWEYRKQVWRRFCKLYRLVWLTEQVTVA